MTELAVPVVLAGALAIEGTSLGQFMVSRPLVAGTIAGALAGDAVQGLLVGSVLELFFLPVLPIGGGRLPEPGPACVVAGWVGAASGGPGGLAVGVLLGLALGLAGGWTQYWVRGLVTRFVPQAGDPRLASKLTAVQWWSLTMDGLRGLALAVVGLAAGIRFGPPLVRAWPLSDGGTLLLLLVAAAVPAGSLLATLGGLRRQGAWTAGGIALGALLAVLS